MAPLFKLHFFGTRLVEEDEMASSDLPSKLKFILLQLVDKGKMTYAEYRTFFPLEDTAKESLSRLKRFIVPHDGNKYKLELIISDEGKGDARILVADTKRFSADILEFVNHYQQAQTTTLPVEQRLKEIRAALKLKERGDLLAGSKVYETMEVEGKSVKQTLEALQEEYNTKAQMLNKLRDDLIEAQLAANRKQPDKAPADSYTRPFDISQIRDHVPEILSGRYDETGILDQAWDQAIREEAGRPHIITVVGIAGQGKTSLVAHWAANLWSRNATDIERVFAWSFTKQASGDVELSPSAFLEAALKHFSDAKSGEDSANLELLATRLAGILAQQRSILILDGLELFQYLPGRLHDGKLKPTAMYTLLEQLARGSRGLCIVTSRYHVSGLQTYLHNSAREIQLGPLATEHGAALLAHLEVTGDRTEIDKFVESVRGHPLTLNLVGNYLYRFGGNVLKRDLFTYAQANATEDGRTFDAIDLYVRWFENNGEAGRRSISILMLLGLFDRAADAGCLKELMHGERIGSLTDCLVPLTEDEQALEA
jgi:hypothetical protein